MTPVPATVPRRRTVLFRTPGLRPLVLWVLATALCYSFLPGTIWGVVRWVLGAALLIEMIFLVSRKFRPQA